jgi:hypothetical protein
VGAKLAGDEFVVSTSASSHSSARRVLILHGERIYPPIRADSYPESIRLAALALSQFLEDLSECAADQERGCNT